MIVANVAFGDYPSIVQYLLEHGANALEIDDHGRNIIMLAIIHHHHEVK